MQILMLNGEDAKSFPANSDESPLRALIEAQMDTPEMNPILVTEITTREGKSRLRSVYSDDSVVEMSNKILDERYACHGDEKKG